MYTCRGSMMEDYAVICTFPQNIEECFSMGFLPKDYPVQPEVLQAKAESRWKPTVVLHGDQVVGYANLYGVQEAKHGWLGNVIVRADYRGKGAASALIEEMLRIAREELDLPKLLLVCHNTNTSALLFYHKLGFKPFDINKMKNHLDSTIVGIHMEHATAVKV